MPKIFITGTSGIGKTTLAEYISKRLRIPFVVGSSKVLWEKYGINSHLDILKMGLNEPQKGLEFQWELLNYRIEESKKHEHFVTDRSPIDNAVYFLLQNGAICNDLQIKEYLFKCFDYFSTSSNNKIIWMNHEVADEKPKIENDNMRIANDYFQNNVVGPIFSQIFLDIDNRKLSIGSNDYLNLDVWNWESRLNEVDKFIR